MADLKQAARQALAKDIKDSVLELSDGRRFPDLMAAIDQLAALSQPAEAQRKPVAWIEHALSGTGERLLHFARRAPTVRDDVTNPIWTPLYTHPAAQPVQVPEDERNAFERWFEGNRCLPGENWFRRDIDEPEEYLSTHTAEAWDGWKARAMLAAAPLPPAQPEHVPEAGFGEPVNRRLLEALRECLFYLNDNLGSLEASLAVKRAEAAIAEVEAQPEAQIVCWRGLVDGVPATDWIDGGNPDVSSIEPSGAIQVAYSSPEIAGMQSAINNLSMLVEEQRALLVEVEDVCGRDGHGGPLEDGESELIDKVRLHLEKLNAPTTEAQPMSRDGAA